MSPEPLVHAAALLAAGLNAGVFFAFTVAVMPALREAESPAFVRTMRDVNDKILNGWFLSVFLGTPAATAASAVLRFIDGDGSAVGWTAVALAASLLTVAVTGAVNVPLNNRLAQPGGADALESPAADALRSAFEPRWVRWNTVRTVTSTVTLAALALAVTG